MTEKHEDKDVVEFQKYELGYHLVPSLGEEDLALRVRELMEAVTAIGGKVLSEGVPQPCALAYTMRRLRGGVWEKYDTSFFGWMRFEAAPEGAGALHDALAHNAYIIRSLTLKLEGKALAPAPEPRQTQPVALKEVSAEPKVLEKKHDNEEEKGDVSVEELDKQIEDLIK